MDSRPGPPSPGRRLHALPSLLAAVVLVSTSPANAMPSLALDAGDPPPAASRLAPADEGAGSNQPATPAVAAARPADLYPQRLASPPLVDGVLDDEAWQAAPLETGEFLSYDPLHGDRIPQQTRVWMAYDADYLYLAFRCDDPDPGGIKTSVTRRDALFADDWVGVSLDALGTGQLSYHLMVNPSGVQADMLNSIAGGEDLSPDFVWDSAGRLTSTGYAVEIRIPLQSIRFRGGADVRMGVLFWRRVSRLGISVAWPALTPGTWVFEQHAPLRFPELRPQLPREAIPSATYARNQARTEPDRWDVDGQGDLGLSAKVGLTPTITLDATVNPDFSQVESDAFQVEVNRRFPVFFSEKRPFFMEGAGIFTLAGQGNDNSLQAAVHTRRIVDPVFGAKLTGSAGRVTFATLTALDEAPGRDVAPGHPDLGKDRLFNVARAQFSLGPGNYVGALASDTQFAGTNNRVAGADLSWRITGTQRVSAFVLGSQTRRRAAVPSDGLPVLPSDGPDDVPQGEIETVGGVGAQAGYEYSTRRMTIAAFGEHYDRAFAMETAFINRVGLTSAWGFVEYNFYPDKVKYPWIRRISAFTFTQGGRDRVAGGTELLEVYGARLRFTRQGFFRADRFEGFERWAGRRFDRARWRFMGEVQLYRWLSMNAEHETGAAVFYDPVAPFQGRSRETEISTKLQPTGRLSQEFSYEHVAFDRESTGERVFDVSVAYSRTTYQFTRQFFVRGIVQHDSSRHRVLTDLLASYELRPGTVVFAGYGSVLERRAFIDRAWILGQGEYRTSQRGLFFKASYLHRF